MAEDFTNELLESGWTFDGFDNFPNLGSEEDPLYVDTNAWVDYYNNVMTDEEREYYNSLSPEDKVQWQQDNFFADGGTYNNPGLAFAYDSGDPEGWYAKTRAALDAGEITLEEMRPADVQEFAYWGYAAGDMDAETAQGIYDVAYEARWSAVAGQEELATGRIVNNYFDDDGNFVQDYYSSDGFNSNRSTYRRYIFGEGDGSREDYMNTTQQGNEQFRRGFYDGFLATPFASMAISMVATALTGPLAGLLAKTGLSQAVAEQLASALLKGALGSMQGDGLTWMDALGFAAGDLGINLDEIGGTDMWEQIGDDAMNGIMDIVRDEMNSDDPTWQPNDAAGDNAPSVWTQNEDGSWSYDPSNVQVQYPDYSSTDDEEDPAGGGGDSEAGGGESGGDTGGDSGGGDGGDTGGGGEEAGCPDGQVRNDNGDCITPEVVDPPETEQGQYEVIGTTDDGGVIVRDNVDGDIWVLPEGGYEVGDIIPEEEMGGARGWDPEMGCPDGYSKNANGLCVPTDVLENSMCGDTQTPNAMGECVDIVVTEGGNTGGETGGGDDEGTDEITNPCGTGMVYDDLLGCIPDTNVGGGLEPGGPSEGDPCPAGYRRDEETGECYDPNPCPNGYHKNEVNECVPDEGTGGGVEVNPGGGDGTVPCPAGYARNENGDCVKTGDGGSGGGGGEGKCPDGSEPNADGSCGGGGGEGTCPDGSDPDPETGECNGGSGGGKCPDGSDPDANGECKGTGVGPCPPGSVRDSISGQCVDVGPGGDGEGGDGGDGGEGDGGGMFGGEGVFNPNYITWNTPQYKGPGKAILTPYEAIINSLKNDKGMLS